MPGRSYELLYRKELGELVTDSQTNLQRTLWASHSMGPPFQSTLPTINESQPTSSYNGKGTRIANLREPAQQPSRLKKPPL